MTWVREVLDQARRQPFIAGAGVLLVVSSILSAYSGWAAWDAQRDNRADAEIDAAQRCVTAWETREDIRDAVERGTRGGARVAAEALIGVVADADPADVEALRELTDQQSDAEVAAARAEIPNPNCDLAAAQARLDP